MIKVAEVVGNGLCRRLHRVHNRIVEGKWEGCDIREYAVKINIRKADMLLPII